MLSDQRVGDHAIGDVGAAVGGHRERRVGGGAVADVFRVDLLRRPELLRARFEFGGHQLVVGDLFDRRPTARPTRPAAGRRRRRRSSGKRRREGLPVVDLRRAPARRRPGSGRRTGGAGLPRACGRGSRRCRRAPSRRRRRRGSSGWGHRSSLARARSPRGADASARRTSGQGHEQKQRRPARVAAVRRLIEKAGECAVTAGRAPRC